MFPEPNNIENIAKPAGITDAHNILLFTNVGPKNKNTFHYDLVWEIRQIGDDHRNWDRHHNPAVSALRTSGPIENGFAPAFRSSSSFSVKPPSGPMI